MDDGARRSWWPPVAAAVVAVLAVACLVGYAAVRAALVAGDPGEPGVAVPVAPWPRPSGEQCRTGLAGLCADDDQGLAPIPGLTAAGWTGRLPEQFRPGYAQQDRDGLLEGTVPIREPVSGKPAGGSGRQMTVNSTGRATLTYGPDNLLRTVECAVDAAGLAPLSPQALDFVRQCVLATATADIAPATGAWLDARLHPEQGPVDPSGAAPATVPWSCGWLSLRLGAGPAHAVAMVTAPRQAPAPCAR